MCKTLYIIAGNFKRLVDLYMYQVLEIFLFTAIVIYIYAMEYVK